MNLLKFRCPYCGNFIQRLPSTQKRSHKDRAEIDPENLYQIIECISIPNIARLYGVTEKTIRKQCRQLGIPLPRTSQPQGNPKIEEVESTGKSI